ncbi:S66 family peptidase [Actinoplanes sp. RD1]|uniref:S66 family peptidase n=1 Tax=Actinoplanes sp. RD1 TaxID=3064538 RepID=UPI0027407019|nr:S66 peptidase family protein [Actinoplanes sp. RD1]
MAVLSLAAPAAAVYPAVHEQGLRRLREQIGVVPVEYPTTRRAATADERARDLMAAWADPGIRAVMATIGGDDQITVLRHLDPAVFLADPKPFFGYSDNTNLLNWLWFHGIAGYHGGSTMVHLAQGGGIDREHEESLRAALFTGGDLDIHPLEKFSDEELHWADPTSLERSATPYASPGWTWHQPDKVVSAPAWGGSLEILNWTTAVSRWIRPVEDYSGCVLLLETSEELPSAENVFHSLRNFGERGLLEQFPAVLFAQAKGTAIGNEKPVAEREKYREEQREAVLKAFATYHPEAMIVFGVDFGHTSPQWILPYGGRITVDGPARKVTAHF